MTTQRPILSVEEIWRKYDDDEQRLTAPVSERMLDLADLRPGMRVLDLATGRGEPAVRAAHRVGPSGYVLGVDIADRMLQMARERATNEKVINLELRVANAETLEGVSPNSFDVTLARWCLMYFQSPVEALRAARRAMVAQGRLVAAVWAEPERVSYHSFPRDLLEKYKRLPQVSPEEPSTFRLSDPKRIHRDFEEAGFQIESIEEMEIDVMEASSEEELIAWVRAFGLNRLMSDLSEELQTAWETDMIRAAKPLKKEGFVRLGGVTRIIVASSSPQPS